MKTYKVNFKFENGNEETITLTSDDYPEIIEDAEDGYYDEEEHAAVIAFGLTEESYTGKSMKYEYEVETL